MTNPPVPGPGFATIFECEPPPPGQWFAIIRAEWNADFTARRVLEVKVCDPILGAEYMIIPAGGDAR